MPAPMPGRGMPAVPGRAVTPTPVLLNRKHGGKAEGGESKAAEKAEMHEMHKIEKELKHHEHMPAKKAHHGLKHGGKAHMAKGGKAHAVPGGLLGGVEDYKAHSKGATGDVEGPGYKHGGKVHHVSGHPVGSHKHHLHMAKHHAAKHAEGGSAHHHKMHEHHKHAAKMAKGGGTLHPAIDVNDKVVEAKQVKGFHTKSGGVEGTGYKRGGHTKKHHYAKGGTVSDSVAKRYENTEMHDGEHSPMQKKRGTGEIHQAPAGYKKGGHVHHGHVEHEKHHMHKAEGGHMHMSHVQKQMAVEGHKHFGAGKHTASEGEHHAMKRGGHAHKAKGGKCNY